MVTIVIAGPRARLFGITSDELPHVRRVCSYPVGDGAVFSAVARGVPWKKASEQKKQKTVSLLRYSEGGYHTVPTGLIPDVCDALTDLAVDFTVDDQRPKLGAWRDFGFEGGMRRYQLEAVRDFVTGRGDALRAGTGIFKHGVRSGKTRSAARTIAAYGVPSLFVVTSQILLRQAHEVLSALLTRASVTCVGEGMHDVSGDVVVCTVHSLLKAKQEGGKIWRALCARALVVCDEVHHLENADKWSDAVMALRARVRLGLSATVWMNPNEVDPDDVLLKACTGPVLNEVSMADLMERGFLVPCTVRIREVDEPEKHRSKPYREALTSCLFENHHRNDAIVDEVTRAHEEGYRGIIVTTNRVKHAELLTDMLNDAHMRATHLVGDHRQVHRDDAVSMLVDNKLDVVVSTVLSEGVDIPGCEAVIVGEGGKSRRAALQRMRCLTPAPGKTRALLVDFRDKMNSSLDEHSDQRRWAYEKEGCFTIEVKR